MALWRVIDGFSGGDPSTSSPTAGGRVHTIDTTGRQWNQHAAPGTVWRIRAGESLSKGDQLATNGAGEAVQAQSGDRVVAEALESAGSGEDLWVVMQLQEEAP